MRLAYISSIDPADNHGGPLQIRRHFIERSDFEFREFNEGKAKTWWESADPWPPNVRIHPRIRSSRLRRHLLPLAFRIGVGAATRRLEREVGGFRPDAIVTVAFGHRAFVAQRLAARMRIPLITFFHDWWPDLLPNVPAATQHWLDQEMRRLAGSSALVLAVSQEMLVELGSPLNGSILRPVPAARIRGGDRQRASVRGAAGGRITLVYAGTLGGAYGAMIRELAIKTMERPNRRWSLKVYGPTPEWGEAECNRWRDEGIYGGALAQGEPLAEALAKADVMLVVMSFSPENARRMRTSFPSKLPDYTAYGKPIVVWGPEGSSAIEFCRREKAARLVTVADPAAMLAAVDALCESEDERARLSRAAAGLAEAVCDPEVIHAELKRRILALLGKPAPQRGLS